jgi:hypothetical protein
MSVTAELVRLERGFWLESADFYRQNLAEEVLMVFPGAGVMRRADVIEGIEAAPRWLRVEIGGEQLLELGPESRLLCYHALAHRDGESEYSALVSSVYVRRGGAWKLVFHQQSPSQ